MHKSSTPKRDSRVTSPYLTIYRPQLTSVLSISHRFSGIILLKCMGLFALAISLGLLAPNWWDKIYYAMPVWLTKLFVLLFGVTASYHWLNGIRHLLWDKLIGLEINQVYFSGRLVIAFFVVIVAGFCVYLFN